MTVLILVSLLAVTCVPLCHSELQSSSLEEQLFNYKSQIRIVHQLLATDCPFYMKGKREESDKVLKAKVEVQKIHYEQLLQLLIACRENKSKCRKCSH